MAFKHSAPYDFCILSFLLLLRISLLSYTSAQRPSLHSQSGTLQVLVPNKTLFTEFVDCSSGPSAVRGFCIDAFRSANSILVPKPTWTDINYSCYDIGSSGSYDSMFEDFQSNKSFSSYDAIIGDTTISADRMKGVSFTQSYLDSGIVLLTPAVGVSQHFPGVFFAPFTPNAWYIVIVSTIFTGVALWVIERNEYQRSLSESEQFRFIFRFVTSVLVFFKQESPVSPISKFLLMAWTIFILLLGSSYTASLSSILTVNKLYSNGRGLDDLKSKNLSIGYQTKSVVKDYLERIHGITNLVELKNTDEYAEKLGRGDLAAIADESPYISLFLQGQPASKCIFSVSSKVTTEGLGFAFRDGILSAAFSVAILNLSESGELQKLQDGWKLTDFHCPSQIQATQLDLQSSQGLFVLLGSVMLICIFLFLLKKITPCFGRVYVRLRGNQQRDVTEAYWEASVGGSMRRWRGSAATRQTLHERSF